LFSLSSSTPSHYSIKDNPNIQSFSESIQPALSAGTYVIAVDAFITPNGSVSYNLDIAETSHQNKVTVEDWYSFTLASQTTVTINLDVEGDSAGYDSFLDLYLFDESGTSLIASSQNDAEISENLSITLDAGTYTVGVDLLNIWNAQYSLSVQ